MWKEVKTSKLKQNRKHTVTSQYTLPFVQNLKTSCLAIRIVFHKDVCGSNCDANLRSIPSSFPSMTPINGYGFADQHLCHPCPFFYEVAPSDWERSILGQKCKASLGQQYSTCMTFVNSFYKKWKSHFVLCSVDIIKVQWMQPIKQPFKHSLS